MRTVRWSCASSGSARRTRLSAIIRLMERAADRKAAHRRTGRSHRQLFRRRAARAGDAVGHRLVAGRSVAALVGFRFGAGGQLPLRPVAGDAGRADRGDRRAGRRWPAGDARACHRDAGAGDAFRFRQDRHADRAAGCDLRRTCCRPAAWRATSACSSRRPSSRLPSIRWAGALREAAAGLDLAALPETR